MAESKKITKKGLGRRKRSIASVWLHAGEGNIIVNSKKASEYFPGQQSVVKLLKPFNVLDINKYDASVKVNGGGKAGQLDATILGISRALAEIKNEFREKLRESGLLTRDSRKKQRRMVGTGGKSRRRKQSPKR